MIPHFDAIPVAVDEFPDKRGTPFSFPDETGDFPDDIGSGLEKHPVHSD
jgi:hypothetical protein